MSPFLFLSVYVFPRHLYLATVAVSLLLAVLIKEANARFIIERSKTKVFALILAFLVLMAMHAAFNMGEGEKDFGGHETERVVNELLSRYPELPQNTTVVFVDFPLIDWAMEDMADVYYTPTFEVYVTDGREARHLTGVLRDTNTLFLTYQEGKVVETTL